MKKRTDYKICEYCGAALDVGEVCDCRKPVNRLLQGCMFYTTRSCKGCSYNSVPYAHVGSCTLLEQNKQKYAQNGA